MTIRKIIDKIFTKEFIMYGICGGITTIFSIALYWILLRLDIDYKISNVITIISTKILAYILNKFLVFKTKTENLSTLSKEILRFALSRGFTMLIDYFGLIFMVEVLAFNNFYSKIFLAIIAIILNYILGKKAVFKKCLILFFICITISLAMGEKNNYLIYNLSAHSLNYTNFQIIPQTLSGDFSYQKYFNLYNYANSIFVNFLHYRQKLYFIVYSVIYTIKYKII